MSTDAEGKQGQVDQNQQKKSGPKPGLIVVILLAVAAGAYFYMSGKGKVATDNAQVHGHKHQVTFQVAGRVVEVRFDDNQIVKEGDMLLRLDDADYKESIKKAEAALAQAKASRQAAAAELAQRTFQRDQIDKAYKENPGAVSLDRYEQSKNDFSAAEAQVAQADAAILSSQAQLDLAKLNLSYCTVSAPASGQIAQKSVEVGNYVMPGTPLAYVVDVENTWVLANYKETELEDIRPGQRVVMTSDIYPNWEFEGVVDSLDSGTGAAFGLFPPQNATGNYVKIVQRVPVKVVVPKEQRDPDRPLKLGMNIIATAFIDDTTAPDG